MCKIWPTSLRWLGLEMRIRKHTILYKLYTNPETALSARLVSLASRPPGLARLSSSRDGSVASRDAARHPCCSLSIPFQCAHLPRRSHHPSGSARARVIAHPKHRLLTSQPPPRRPRRRACSVYQGRRADQAACFKRTVPLRTRMILAEGGLFTSLEGALDAFTAVVRRRCAVGARVVRSLPGGYGSNLGELGR